MFAASTLIVISRVAVAAEICKSPCSGSSPVVRTDKKDSDHTKSFMMVVYESNQWGVTKNLNCTQKCTRVCGLNMKKSDRKGHLN